MPLLVLLLLFIFLSSDNVLSVGCPPCGSQRKKLQLLQFRFILLWLDFSHHDGLLWMPFVDCFFNLKLNADFSVTVLDEPYILIKLANDLNYSRVFCHKSYLLNNYFMKLTKWSPSLDIGVESPVIPIWISFPNLRPHLFTP